MTNLEKRIGNAKEQLCKLEVISKVIERMSDDLYKELFCTLKREQKDTEDSNEPSFEYVWVEKTEADYTWDYDTEKMEMAKKAFKEIIKQLETM